MFGMYSKLHLATSKWSSGDFFLHKWQVLQHRIQLQLQLIFEPITLMQHLFFLPVLYAGGGEGYVRI